jgi:hypothetical protein
MTIPSWVVLALLVVLVGLWLLRGRRERLDPRLLPAHVFTPERRVGCTQVLLQVVLVLVALYLMWVLLGAEFGGLVVRFSF